MSTVRKKHSENGSSCDSPSTLAAHVEEPSEQTHLPGTTSKDTGWLSPAKPEPKSDCRVEMSSRDVAETLDEGGQHEPEAEADSHLGGKYKQIETGSNSITRTFPGHLSCAKSMEKTK